MKQSLQIPRLRQDALPRMGNVSAIAGAAFFG